MGHLDKGEVEEEWGNRVSKKFVKNLHTQKMFF